MIKNFFWHRRQNLNLDIRLSIQYMWISGFFQLTWFSYMLIYWYISVRAMKYMLNMNANTKIPDDLVHKLPFRWFRTWFQCLEQLWFNFKICRIFTQLLVVFRQPFWYGASIVKELQLKVPAEPAENYRSENRNCRNKYTLSTDRQSS